MEQRWILVSDASRARVFSQPKKSPDLELIATFAHPDSRARVRDLMADATGSKPVGQSMGASYGGRSVSYGLGRPGVEPETDAKEVEAIKFARELATMLAKRFNEGAYRRLVVAAPPHFLGLLKASLDSTVAKRIELSIPKDFTKLELDDIQSRVRAELAPH